MRILRTSIVLSAIFLFAMVPVLASPTAERQFQTLQSLDLNAQTMQSLIQSYDNLNASVAREAQEARKALEQARSRGDKDAYLEARSKLNTLSSFRMDQATSDYILQKLLELPDAEMQKTAAWLYQNSSFYRPVLTLDFSSEGPNYRYSFRQQIGRQPGSKVTLPDASQIRLNTAHIGILAGWGLTPEEITYEAGQTIEMGYTNQTLYAIYKPGVRFYDERSKTDLFYEIEDVVVPTDLAPIGSAVFAGWYDRTTAQVVTDSESLTVEGKGAFFEALWKDLSIDRIGILYYNHQNLPANTQLALGFSYRNVGNVDFSSLKATLSSDSEYVTFLVDELQLGSLPSAHQATNNSRISSRTAQRIRGEGNTFRFVISKDAPSSTVIPMRLTLIDEKGNSWTEDIECVVR